MRPLRLIVLPQNAAEECPGRAHWIEHDPHRLPRPCLVQGQLPIEQVVAPRGRELDQRETLALVSPDPPQWFLIRGLLAS